MDDGDLQEGFMMINSAGSLFKRLVAADAIAQGRLDTESWISFQKDK
jgi:hypothetical protein